MPKTASRPWKIFYTPKGWKRPPILWSAYATEERRNSRFRELQRAQPEAKWVKRCDTKTTSSP